MPFVTVNGSNYLSKETLYQYFIEYISEYNPGISINDFIQLSEMHKLYLYESYVDEVFEMTHNSYEECVAHALIVNKHLFGDKLNIEECVY